MNSKTVLSLLQSSGRLSMVHLYIIYVFGYIFVVLLVSKGQFRFGDCKFQS